VKLKISIYFCSKFIQETVHEILSEHITRTFWSPFFRTSVHLAHTQAAHSGFRSVVEV